MAGATALNESGEHRAESTNHGGLNQSVQSKFKNSQHMNRSKKEAKKIQRCESNSIDEEEFQDCKFYSLLVNSCMHRLHKPDQEEGIRSAEETTADEGDAQRKFATYDH